MDRAAGEPADGGNRGPRAGGDRRDRPTVTLQSGNTVLQLVDVRLGDLRPPGSTTPANLPGQNN